MSTPPTLTTRYPGLSAIKDPQTQQVLKHLFDMIGGVQLQGQQIGTVTQPLTAHLNANAKQLKSVADPTDPKDAVTLEYLQHYVESRVQTTAAATVASIPGSATGPPVEAPPSGVVQPPGIPPGPPGTPPSGTGTLTRGFDLSTAVIENSPGDIASWPATCSISQVTIDDTGVSILGSLISPPYAASADPGLWPAGTDAGADFNIQYTVWALVQISGVWYASGIILMWVGRPSTGALLGNWGNWAYDARWGPMPGFVVAPGVQMGFFVSAGNARGTSSPNTVRERSEVVLLNLPDVNGAVYT